MKTIGRILKCIYWTVTLLAMLLACSAATYAWFSSNRTVGTDRVSGRTGTDSVELLLSETGGEAFDGAFSADIVQVNRTDSQSLRPVSTADLKTFVCSPRTEGDMAAYFQVVEAENGYYHGRVYLRAAAEGQDTDARMALYLDQDSGSGGAVVQAVSGNLLHAARLGLTFDGDNAVIFSLSDTENESSEQVRNTVLGGTLLGDGQVLGYQDGAVKGVPDPAVSLSEYTISMEKDMVRLPKEPLVYLELNRTYAVDIYFYLEGCDPDCSDSIQSDAADLHLSFYGILG